MVTRLSRATLLICACTILLAFAPRSHALDPAYLREWPTAEQVLADHEGRDRQDTMARQMAALHHLHRSIEDMADTRRWHGLTPDEERLRGQYWTAAERIRDEVNATLSNELPPGFNGPFAKPPLQKWYSLQWKYERDPQVRAATLGRYLPPALLETLDAKVSESDARAAAAGRELLEGLGHGERSSATGYVMPLVVVGMLGLLFLLLRRRRRRATPHEAATTQPQTADTMVDIEQAVDEVMDCLEPSIVVAARLAGRERLPASVLEHPKVIGFMLRYCCAAIVAISGRAGDEFARGTRVYEQLLRGPRLHNIIDWRSRRGTDAEPTGPTDGLVDEGSKLAGVILATFGGKDLRGVEELDRGIAMADANASASDMTIDMPVTLLHPEGPHARRGYYLLEYSFLPQLVELAGGGGTG